VTSGGDEISEEQAPYAGGATGAHMSDAGDLTDAKIVAAEARTDTKIARLEGKVDLIVAKIDALGERLGGLSDRFSELRDDNRATRVNQWVIGFGLALLIIAIAALFPVFFDLGSKIRDMVDHAVQAHAIKNS
jgi:hypothetical protein